MGAGGEGLRRESGLKRLRNVWPSRPIWWLSYHTGKIVEYSVGKLFLTYFVPDVFLWVEPLLHLRVALGPTENDLVRYCTHCSQPVFQVAGLNDCKRPANPPCAVSGDCVIGRR